MITTFMQHGLQSLHLLSSNLVDVMDYHCVEVLVAALSPKATHCIQATYSVSEAIVIFIATNLSSIFSGRTILISKK